MSTNFTVMLDGEPGPFGDNLEEWEAFRKKVEAKSDLFAKEALLRSIDQTIALERKERRLLKGDTQ